MVKSIQIFRYNLCPSKAEIRTILGTKKTKTRQERDRITTGEKISLKTTFSKIYETDDGIGGTITHEIQQKIPHSDNEYQIWYPKVTFLIIPDLQLLVLHGDKKTRDQVLDVIEELLSNDSDSIIQVIHIPKNKLDELVDAMRLENRRNRVAYHKNKNDSISDNEGIEDHAYKMHKGKCATDISRYAEEKGIASSYDCKVGLVKFSGLIDEEVQEEFLLRITSRAEFGFSKDLEPKHWNRFVLERCRVIL